VPDVEPVEEEPDQRVLLVPVEPPPMEPLPIELPPVPKPPPVDPPPLRPLPAEVPPVPADPLPAPPPAPWAYPTAEVPAINAATIAAVLIFVHISSSPFGALSDLVMRPPPANSRSGNAIHFEQENQMRGTKSNCRLGLDAVPFRTEAASVLRTMFSE
jgi:hypothetical protein